MQPWEYAKAFLDKWGHEYDRCDKDQLEDALQEYFAFLELADIIPTRVEQLDPGQRSRLRKFVEALN